MKKIYSFIVITIILSAFGNVSIAQDSIVVSSLQKDASTSNWHLLKQVNSVKVYYQYIENGPIEFINLKVENTSNVGVTVSWDYEFINNGSAIPINPDDASVTISLNPSQVVIGSQNINLSIYVKESGLPLRLTTIKLNNLNVTQ